MRDKTALPVVLGLGSNQGDSRRIVLDAVTALEEVLAELKRASLYETAPLHVTDQERFINTAVSGFFPGSPRELLERVHDIEARFGRNRAKERRWRERSLDIDILLFGNLLVNEPESSAGRTEAGESAYSGLIIPHPRLKERRFALQPLLEILPGAVEPGTGLSYRNICEALPDQEVKRIVSV